ncbi:hypothetical protein C8J57DRAFT_1508916 [Mycena rebaudengoi]|nr:hypothetical protein C8J57DRAFT_1508916 [Mycena rebaudengoi]
MLPVPSPYSQTYGAYRAPVVVGTPTVLWRFVLPLAHPHRYAPARSSARRRFIHRRYTHLLFVPFSPPLFARSSLFLFPFAHIARSVPAIQRSVRSFCPNSRFFPLQRSLRCPFYRVHTPPFATFRGVSPLRGYGSYSVLTCRSYASFVPPLGHGIARMPPFVLVVMLAPRSYAASCTSRVPPLMPSFLAVFAQRPGRRAFFRAPGRCQIAYPDELVRRRSHLVICRLIYSTPLSFPFLTSSMPALVHRLRPSASTASRLYALSRGRAASLVLLPVFALAPLFVRARTPVPARRRSGCEELVFRTRGPARLSPVPPLIS